MDKQIIFLVTNDITTDQRMQRICSSMTAAGYRCLLVGRCLPHSVPLPNFPFSCVRLRCIFHQGKLFYLEFNLRLFFFLATKRMGTICAVDLDTLVPAVLMAKLKRKKLVYDAHEYFTEVPEVVDRRVVQWVWERIASWGIPKMDICYTVGNKLAKELERRYKREFGVVRNVPRYQETKPGLAREYILYQGALNHGRGLEELIAAAPHLPLPVYLAGDGDLNLQLREMAQGLAPDRVVFLGRLSPLQLKEVTARAFIGYNLLENKGLSYYFSLANKVFDYTMAGVPSLVSPFPEYLDLQDEFQIGLVCELNSHDIVTKVNALWTNPNGYDTLCRNCLVAAQVLNWEREEGKLVDLYKALMS